MSCEFLILLFVLERVERCEAEDGGLEQGRGESEQG